jgi:hypothetical protein
MMNSGVAQAIGTGISVVPVFFLVFDIAIRLMQIGPMKDSFVQRGYPVDSAVTIGLLALGCIAWLWRHQPPELRFCRKHRATAGFDAGHRIRPTIE